MIFDFRELCMFNFRLVMRGISFVFGIEGSALGMPQQHLWRSPCSLHASAHPC